MAIVGAEARLVQVEVDVGNGVPKFPIVGLPTKSVREAEQRTRSALLASDFRWPPHRITANLAPAEMRKDGTHFDLPLAIGVLAADGHLAQEHLDGWMILGELALNGDVRSVRGTLAAAIECKRAGRRGLICPSANAAEAVAVEGLRVVPVGSLRQCFQFLRGEIDPPAIEVVPARQPVEVDDLREVRGQGAAKRALEVAAAGGHNVLLCGPPGAGKTMLARRLPGILPPMSQRESLAVTSIYSVAGLLPERESLITERPFRAPHHHISTAGLIGGGSGLARPGEVSLAHLGVLFLDELPMYKGDALEALRGPIEDGVVRLARSGGCVAFPCSFALVAAMNPCPCGHDGDPQRTCECRDVQVLRYKARISGPLLDRFDMEVPMARLTTAELMGEPEGESSGTIRARVAAARDLQRARYRDPEATNAAVPLALLEATIALVPDARALLGTVIESLGLTGRGLNRLLRVARTLADLDGSPEVGADHVAKAAKYRIRHAAVRAA